MSNVINFQERLEKRQSNEEVSNFNSYFASYVLPLLSFDQKEQLLTAIETKDTELLDSIISPIIRRNAMKSFN